MKTREQYQILAPLFCYPDENYKSDVKKTEAFIRERYPQLEKEFRPFFDWVENTPIDEVEEVFSKTFHIQAICFLDLGYVLFAEDYKRGEFLVQMKRELAEANVDTGNELADNLPNVLRWMSVMENDQFLEEFSLRVLKHALGKMLEEFDLARMELKDKVRKKKQKVILLEDLSNKNIYQYAIQGLLNLVKVDYPENKFNDPKIVPTLGGNFIKDCSSGSCSSTHQTQKTV